MSALSLSLIAFLCIFGATLLGVYLRQALPTHHLSTDTKETVRLSALFLIFELVTPFSGLMPISDAPLRHALAPL